MLSQLDHESKGQGHSKQQKPMPYGTCLPKNNVTNVNERH